LKTFHPNKCNNNNKSIKQTQENIDNKNNDENKENIINEAIPKDNTKINDEKITIEIKEEKEEIKKENIKIIENIEIEENKKDKKVEKEEENKAKHDKKDKNNTSEKNQQEQKELKDQKVQKEKEINNERNNNNLHIENTNDIAQTTNDTIELNTSQEKVIYFDINHITDVQIPKDYLNVIYYNLLDEENKELPAKPVHTYMKKQKEINDQMRSILVDWIIDVHHKFGFTDETLFMTILIIDRYCSIEQISRIKYQCLGITALMIACKHEEINVPKVEDFIYITDNAYTKEEVFKMENDVLSKLNFELLFPSPIKFYEYLSLHFNFCKKYHMLGKYLMETFLLDLKYIKYKPSIISCACTYIVMKFFKMENYRHSYEKKFFLLDENVNTIPNGYGVKDCAQYICIYVDNINNTNLLSCQKKYSKTEFEKVATLISNNKT
jgi:cyclin B